MKEIKASSDMRAVGPLRIALTGQALIQADIRKLNPSVVEGIKPLLAADVAFTDIETTIAEPGDSIDSVNPAMGDVVMPPEALDALVEMGINLYATSNNHSFDLGRTGMINLNRNLDQRGLAHAGIRDNRKEAAAPVYLDTDKGSVAMISVASGLLKPESVATDTSFGVFEVRLEGGTPDVDAGQPVAEDTQMILESIQEARKNADYVISYHHNHVYDVNFVQMMRQQMPHRLVPPPWVKTWSHAQIDAGADMVVVHGTPVFKGLELYKGKPIFYGLGNFIFQMPLCIKDFEPGAYEGVIARVEVEDHMPIAISFEAIEIDPAGASDVGEFSVLTRGLPRPLTGDRAASVLQRMADLSSALGTNITIDGDRAIVRIRDAHRA